MQDPQLKAIAAAFKHDKPVVEGNVLSVDFGNGPLSAEIDPRNGTVLEKFDELEGGRQIHPNVVSFVVALLSTFPLNISLNDRGEVVEVNITL